jgi:hypothetical protein
MATRFEDQPWHREWREALDRVIAAQMRRDGAKLGTPEREAANREHEAALVAFSRAGGENQTTVLMSLQRSRLSERGDQSSGKRRGPITCNLPLRVVVLPADS